MNKIALLFVALVCLIGCQGTTTIEVSVGHEFEGPWVSLPGDLEPWVGEGPVVEAAVRQTYDNGTFVEYRHTSSLLSGKPFNNHLENSLDRVSIGKIFTIKKDEK